jgi:hypothetical protein
LPNVVGVRLGAGAGVALGVLGVFAVSAAGFAAPDDSGSGMLYFGFVTALTVFGSSLTVG